MKIAYLVDNNVATVGGEQESTKIIIEGMLSQGAKILLLQPGKRNGGWSDVKQPILASESRLKNVFKNPFLFSRYIYRAYKSLVIFKPEIVHTQAQVSFFLVALLKFLRVLSGEVRFIHTERGIYTKYNRFFRFLFYMCVPQLNVMVCTTSLNKDLWSKAFVRAKVRPDIVVIRNTAGKNFNLTESKRLFRDGIRVGFAGRYCDWKDWPLAESIVEGLYLKCPMLRVTMAVGCLDDASVVSTELMFGRMQNLLGDRFAGSINVDLDCMREFYSSIDVFVLTSTPGAESFGRTVVEAMASGCVVFVTKGGGPPEVVGDSYCVYDDVSALVEKVMELSADPCLATRWSDRNILRATNEFSFDSNIKNHAVLYRRLTR